MVALLKLDTAKGGNSAAFDLQFPPSTLSYRLTTV